MYGDSIFFPMERNTLEPGMVLLSSHEEKLGHAPREAYLVLNQDYSAVAAVRLGVRSDLAVANVLPEWLDVVSKPQVVYIGSEENKEYCVAVGVAKSGVEIADKPHLGKLAQRIVQVDLSQPPEVVMPDLQGLRFFAGFTQWDTSDLFDQIASGWWFVAPALPSDVLSAGDIDVWGDIMRRQEMPLPLYASYPEDPSAN